MSDAKHTPQVGERWYFTHGYSVYEGSIAGVDSCRDRYVVKAKGLCRSQVVCDGRELISRIEPCRADCRKPSFIRDMLMIGLAIAFYECLQAFIRSDLVARLKDAVMQ